MNSSGDMVDRRKQKELNDHFVDKNDEKSTIIKNQRNDMKNIATSSNQQNKQECDGTTIVSNISEEIDEKEAAEAEDGYDLNDFVFEPQFSHCCPALPPRTIPFRSASFSQVDINPEGKYVRIPHSPITLKPTAFCLLNKGKSYASGSATLPKSSKLLNKNKTFTLSSAGNNKFCNQKLTPQISIDLDESPVESAEKLVKMSETEIEPHKEQEKTCSNTDSSTATGDTTTSASTNCSNENEKLVKGELENMNSSSLIEDVNKDQATEGGGASSSVKFILGEDFEENDDRTEEFALANTSESFAEELTTDINENKKLANNYNLPLPINEAQVVIVEELEFSKCTPITVPDPLGPIEVENSSKENASNYPAVGGGDEGDSADAGSITDNSISPSKLDRQSSTQSDNSSDENPQQSGKKPNSSLDSNNSTVEPVRGGSAGNDGMIPPPPPLPSFPFPTPPLLSLPSCPSGISTDFCTDSDSPQSSSSAGKKEQITRANSVSFSNNLGNNNRRYYKKPLRGPYGEMLEAEMNKLIPGRLSTSTFNIDDDFLVDLLFRETKSSSPGRTTSGSGGSDSPVFSTHSNTSSSNSTTIGTNNSSLGGSTPKMSGSNQLLRSMDDLSIGTSSTSKGDNSLNKFSNNSRSRKISANIPLSSYPVVESGTMSLLNHHQRTSSSPSQLLYAAVVEGGGPPAETCQPQDSPDGPSGNTKIFDRSPRGHVISEILETEKSYVESLRILVKRYIEPLKYSAEGEIPLIDPGLVDDIFFQIPTILWHHEQLLTLLLQKQLANDTQASVGDVLLDTFRQNSLLETYTLFVNNWKCAKGSLKMAVASKPSLARFLELQTRQHKGKLTVDSLLIMPIQRIPRYELLIKELLKHTNSDHEDYGKLNQALDRVKKFATKINYADSNREVEIEGLTNGLGHLVRQDVVTLSSNSNGRKERTIFLFADSLVITSIKRKSAMRKPSSNVLLGNFREGMNLEGFKFKLMSKIQLTDVHILTPSSGVEENELVSVGSSASSSSGNLTSGVSGAGGGTNRSFWSEDVEDMRTINRMMDLASMLKYPHQALDDVLKEIANGLKYHQGQGDTIEFEIKSPEYSNEVYKVHFGTIEKKNLWLEAFQETLGKYVRYGFGKLPQVQFLQALPIRKTRAGLLLSAAAPVKISKTIEMNDVWVANSDGYVGQICILTLHPEPSITSCNGVCNSRITCIISIPPGIVQVQQNQLQHQLMTTSLAVPAAKIVDLTSLGYESEDEIHKKQKPSGNVEHWSVWLGTEDGMLMVYDCSDSVRVKKNRHKIQHKSPLQCILYFDNRVFVALQNGDVAIYSRNQNGKGWLVNEPNWITMGSPSIPVSKMMAIGNAIWCACGSLLKIYVENGGCIELLNSIHIVMDSANCSGPPSSSTGARGISNMIASEDCVWVSVYGSSSLKCFHIKTFELLFEINISSEVSKVLAGSDDIIRQHKIACLRITSLLVTPEKTLWIGTSAGVILTLSQAGKDSKKKSPAALAYGHTGQVRFLTCCVSRDSWTIISGGDGYDRFRPLYPSPNSSFSSIANFLGDSSGNDSSGREDSTNHLLIWKIARIV